MCHASYSPHAARPQRRQLGSSGGMQAPHRVLTGACGALAEPHSEEKVSEPGARTRVHASAKRAGLSFKRLHTYMHTYHNILIITIHMCVCVCIYIYVCVYTSIQSHLFIYLFIYISLSLYIYIYARKYVAQPLPPGKEARGPAPRGQNQAADAAAAGGAMEIIFFTWQLTIYKNTIGFLKASAFIGIFIGRVT